MNMALEIANLSVTYAGSDSPAVQRVSLAIEAGQVFGLVGHSGSGKSTLAMSVGRLLPSDAAVHADRLQIMGHDGLLSQGAALRRLRAEKIGYVFQSPITSLDPTMRIGRQLALVINAANDRRIEAALRTVRISDPERVARSYPHELSGGIAQRVGVALSLARDPPLLIVDEPTSALDASLTAEILDVLLEQKRLRGVAILMLSHDLGAIRNCADRVAVMQDGNIVEQGPTSDVFANPRHDYTRSLLTSGQSFASSRHEIRQPVSSDPIVRIDRVDFSYEKSAGRPDQQTLRQVSMSIAPQEVVALIGESGSGKSTLGRLVLGLERPDGGEVRVTNRRAHEVEPGSTAAVLQNPDWALNPRLKVGYNVSEPLLFRGVLKTERRSQAVQALRDVGLRKADMDRYPGQLSGGQRQRVSIARAMIANPDFIVFDEPVSALDAVVQRQVMQTLADIRQRTRFSALFISHDLAAARHIADRVAVLYAGALVEISEASVFYDRPAHPYARMLIAASAGLPLRVTSASGTPASVGCRFAPRCPWAIDRCQIEDPQLRKVETSSVACHRAEDMSDQQWPEFAPLVNS